MKKLNFTNICAIKWKCIRESSSRFAKHAEKNLSESFPRISLWLLSDFFYSSPNSTFKEQWKEKSRQVQGQLWNIPSAVVKIIWSKSEERKKNRFRQCVVKGTADK